MPAATRSAHPWHFTDFFASSSTFGAPYGHVSTQVPQPMHFSGSEVTNPVSVSFEMAAWGHSAMQSGLSQWLHATDTG